MRQIWQKGLADFDTNPFNYSEGILVDAYGISAVRGSIYNTAKADEMHLGTDDQHDYEIYDPSYPGMQEGNWVTVKYIINESKLVFENLKNGESFDMILPTDIAGFTK